MRATSEVLVRAMNRGSVKEIDDLVLDLPATDFYGGGVLQEEGRFNSSSFCCSRFVVGKNSMDSTQVAGHNGMSPL